jgi:phage terminase large subunit GpA-like protein
LSTRREQILSEFLVQTRPDVIEWLKSNIVIPKSLSPRGAGPFNIDDRPYAAPILRCWHPESGVTDCNVTAGTQVIKTFGMLMGFCYRLVIEPMPSLLVFPSQDFARDRVSKEKLRPLIDENSILAGQKPLNLDDFKDLEMRMQGGDVTLTGANSPTALSGSTRGIVIQDEVCKFEHHESEDSPEAHPMLLADERTKDFKELAFRYKSSSPNHTLHPFWTDWKSGDCTYMVVPCPNSGHFQPLEDIPDAYHENYENGYRSLVWSKDAKDKHGSWIEAKVRESIRYICRKCEYPIKEEEKSGMILKFEEERTNANASKSRRSFRIPSFYSPRITFGDMAWERLKGADFFGYQNYYNSWLALPFSRIDLEVKQEEVEKLRVDSYRKGQIPHVPDYLVVTADPGETSGVHWKVSAVMPNEEIFVIDWDTCLSIEDLESPALIDRWRYPVLNSSRVLGPSRGLIDSRYQSNRVYDMCARSNGFWWPTRGTDASFGTWTRNEIKSKPGLQVFVFVDYTIKNEIYGVRIHQQKPPRVYLPADAGKELIVQLSGQQLIDGRWKRLPNDHWGDCLKQVVLAQWIVKEERSFYTKAAGQ